MLSHDDWLQRLLRRIAPGGPNGPQKYIHPSFHELQEIFRVAQPSVFATGNADPVLPVFAVNESPGVILPTKPPLVLWSRRRVCCSSADKTKPTKTVWFVHL